MLEPRHALLTGATAVVTGAGAGIGKGIAQGFAAFGARVAVVEIVEEAGRRTVAEIEAAGGQAAAFTTDVRDGEAVARAVDAIAGRFGGIDVLVNNVGGTFHAPFVDSVEKGWDALIRTNLKSVLHVTRAVAPGMIARGRGGAIVNIVSIEGERAAPGYAVYAACKAAVINFTRSLALELAPHGIRVNAIAPDICLTEGLERMVREEDRARYPFLVPLGRAGVPDDIAGAAVFLSSPLASYVTGITLHVDGGTHAAGGWYRDAGGVGWVLGPGSTTAPARD
jgi:NAD(P)-dependent dehydrogenase (short-subunit alcohol dehydrogenase family)